ncbi:MAG: aminotransferase class IV [Actinomycetota bacterium]|jgi:branched-chain amino acid aminotransferase|nr:aminotransferase class IV [Actinomycetota bacterium]
MPLVYLNGELVEEDDAVVSVFDHGLVTGDGVFESILVEDGSPFALAEHLARLEQSAALIGLQAPPRPELERGVGLVAAQSKTHRAKVRLTVTGGVGPLASNRQDAPPTVIVALSPLGDEPAGPASVVVVPWPRSERSALVGAKTISYAENVVALAWAEAHGADEALFLNLAGNLCEGTGSNIFVALGGRLLTPPLSAGCLAGVTRALLLEASAAEEGDIPSASLGEVSEAFLTSTTRGVQPISIFDGRSLGELPGPLTESAGTAFEKLAADRRKASGALSS